MEQNPSCAALSMPGLTCVMPAPQVAVNMEFAISANRRQVFVPLGGSLSNILQSGRGVTEIPPALRIRRLYRGHLTTVKFDAANQGMLRFVLMPGDEVTW